MDKPLSLLGGLTPSAFLRDYWQKKPLLIRAALPDFTGLLSPNDLAGLACEDDVQSRLIQHKNKKWNVKNGPFDDAAFANLGEKNWTLLVQSVNQHLPQAAALLALFNFISHARLDDLMVSYAPDGGGVGAHFDSYDVFLLQGSGQRKWQISAQADLALEDAPIKILKNFKSEQEWLLEAADMLYLPPHYAHCGTAVGDDCMTYSIGFRAPKTQELQHEFLNYLQDNIATEGMYADADLALQTHPAEISEAMLKKVSASLQKITWGEDDVADFLGKYFTEPKHDVVFLPARKISKVDFTKKLAQKSLHLNLKSQMLFHTEHFYLNGEKLSVTSTLFAEMRELADTKTLQTPALSANIHAALGDVLYAAYLAGFVDVD